MTDEAAQELLTFAQQILAWMYPTSKSPELRHKTFMQEAEAGYNAIEQATGIKQYCFWRDDK